MLPAIVAVIALLSPCGRSGCRALVDGSGGRDVAASSGKRSGCCFGVEAGVRVQGRREMSGRSVRAVDVAVSGAWLVVLVSIGLMSLSGLALVGFLHLGVVLAGVERLQP